MGGSNMVSAKPHLCSGISIEWQSHVERNRDGVTPVVVLNNAFEFEKSFDLHIER
jgi:hypothetical protein